jgi:probable rRNA maturation factor
LARWLAATAPARVRGEVAVALVTDRRIRSLNYQYRGKDAATDVLSFSPDRSQQLSRAAEGGAALGDIAVATGVARRQARAAGHSYTAELRVLALHGLLHLLGYDHDDARDRGRMARLEARLRRRGGLQQGLIARAGVGPDSARPGPRRSHGKAKGRRAQRVERVGVGPDSARPGPRRSRGKAKGRRAQRVERVGVGPHAHKK